MKPTNLQVLKRADRNAAVITSASLIFVLCKSHSRTYGEHIRDDFKVLRTLLIANRNKRASIVGLRANMVSTILSTPGGLMPNWGNVWTIWSGSMQTVTLRVSNDRVRN